MPNYKKMYFELFNEVSSAIEKLQKIQQKTEEMYIAEQKAEKKTYVSSCELCENMLVSDENE